jgi:hypothetical protein
VPSPNANAYTTLLRDTRTIVMLFNVSIVPVTCAIARLFAASQDTTESGAMLGIEFNAAKATANIVEETEDFRYFEEALRGVLFGDMTLLARCAGRPPLPAGRVYQMYCDAMTAYVVGHEVGHVMLGHLSGSTGQAQPVSAVGQLFSDQQMQELHADAFAYLLNVFVQESAAVSGGFVRSTELFQTAALQAFAGQDLLLRTYWMLEGVVVNLCGLDAKKSRIEGAYPPYGDRLKALRQCADGVIPDHAERLAAIADAHRTLLEQAGRFLVVATQQREPDRQISPLLRTSFGVADAGTR